MCKKGNYWVVWILNGQVHNINTALIRNSSAENIHYSDLNWGTCHTQIGEVEVITRSSHETECQVIMNLLLELELDLVAIQKCLILLQ